MKAGTFPAEEHSFHAPSLRLLPGGAAAAVRRRRPRRRRGGAGLASRSSMSLPELIRDPAAWQASLHRRPRRGRAHRARAHHGLPARRAPLAHARGAAARRPGRQARALARHHLREPDPVRAGRGPGPLPARPRGRPRQVRRRRRRRGARARSDPAAGLPAGLPDLGGGRPRSRRGSAAARRPGPLPRRGHRGGEALRPVPAARGPLRREGLAAASSHPRAWRATSTSGSRWWGCPSSARPDGLALSSRNAYLSADERGRGARPLAGRSARRGRRAGRGSATRRRWPPGPRGRLEAAGVRVDYVELVHPETLAPGRARRARARALLVAAFVGRTRLIDNVALP